MDKQPWCKHLRQADNGRYYINGVMVGEGTMSDPRIDDVWDICPVMGCHAHRPKKKELWEKFKHILLDSHMAYDSAGEWRDETSKKLANEAQAHFKEGT